MRPALDAALTTEYEADAWHLYVPAQKATTRIIWHCGALQEHLC